MKKILLVMILCLLPIFSQGAEELPDLVSENSDLFNPFPPGFMIPPDQNDGWVALPPGRPFPSLLSDPRDLKIAIVRNSIAEWEADIGGYRSLAGWKGEVSGENTVFHTGIEGNAYFTLNKDDNRFPLLSSDGLLGLYGEAIRGNWLYQSRYTHLSAHLSDGLFGMRQPIKYSRETLSFRVARQLDFVRAYVGYHFLVHSTPELKRHAGQFGFYAIFPWHWSRLHPFFGTDFRIKNSQEGSTVKTSTGIALVSSLGAPPLRLTVSYLHGHDPRGQFYTELARLWSISLDLDF